MNHLLSITTSTDRAAVSETNFERLDESLAFMHQPTKVAGVANTEQGPPTGGTYLLHQLWVDSLGGVWRCTVAGTPGTWGQLLPAIVAAFPGAPVVGYRVLRSDLGFAEYVWDGAVWNAVAAPVLYTENNGPPGGGTVGFFYTELDGAPRMFWMKIAGVWTPIMQV